MRKTLALIGGLAAAMVSLAPPAMAQPLPPGDYRSRCRDIAMNGQFLSATCSGARGGGQSSINVLSCPGSNISVDASGALACAGVVGGRPPTGPGYPDGPGYPGGPGYSGGGPGGPGYGGRDIAVVFAKKNFGGQAQRIDGAVANLENFGMNDRIRSIRLERRSGPWLVCSDANFRGRCQRIDTDLADTRRIGMDRSISSLRPLAR
jgi:hypothetical protein